MIKLVAFDWNGTLLADTAICYVVSNRIFTKFGHKEITYTQFLSSYQVPIINFYLVNGFSEKEIKTKIYEYGKFFLKHYESLATRTRTRAGTKEILIWLKKNGFRIGLFSNHTYTGIEFQLKRLGIRHHFDTILTRSFSGEGPGITKIQNLKAFIKKEKYQPEEVIIVGDTQEEIEIGKELGFKTVALTGGNHATHILRKNKPDHLIHRLSHLKRIIKGHKVPVNKVNARKVKHKKK